MSKEIQLSKEDVQKEGVEVRVTQGDIIEMLVSERLSEIEDMYQTLKSTGQDLISALNKDWGDAIKHAASKVKVPKGYKLDDTCINNSQFGGKQFTLPVITNYEARGVITYGRRTHTWNDDVFVKATVKAVKVIDGVTYVGYIPFEFNFSHDPKLIKLVQDYSKQVAEFADSIPAGGFSEKDLTRKIKNEFTKNFVKSMSPDFQKSLKKGFGFNI